VHVATTEKELGSGLGLRMLCTIAAMVTGMKVGPGLGSASTDGFLQGTHILRNFPCSVVVICSGGCIFGSRLCSVTPETYVPIQSAVVKVGHGVP
jgi:hypothetical protein